MECGKRNGIRVRRRRLLAATLAIAALCGGVRADESAEAAYRGARAEMPARLRTLAAWCDGEKLYLERNRACEALLALEPGDEAARRTLHYSRAKDGTWQRGIVPKSSPTDPARLADVTARREEAFGAFRASVLGLVGAGEASVAVRERALGELIGVEPDCLDARAANREKLVKDTWLLEETVTAKSRRKALVDAVGAARKAAEPPPKSSPSPDEATLSTWADVRETDRIRVLGGPKVLEAESVARNADVVGSTYEDVTGSAPAALGRLRLFLFAGSVDGLAAVERDPRLSAEDRTWAKTLTCFPVPNTGDVYVWPVPGVTRVEWGLRQVVLDHLWRTFHVGAKPIWAREGLCHWYSDVMLGTHACYFCRRTEYADAAKKTDDLHKRLFESAADWLAEGRELEKSPRWPDLRISLVCDATASTAEDALVSYLLTRYLVEGRPDVFADVLRSVGKSETPDAWIGTRLGATVEGLDRRLRRFVRESK